MYRSELFTLSLARWQCSTADDASPSKIVEFVLVAREAGRGDNVYRFSILPTQTPQPIVSSAHVWRQATSNCIVANGDSERINT